MGLNPEKKVGTTGNIYYCYNDPIMEGYEPVPFYNEWNDVMAVVEKINEKMGIEEDKFILKNRCAIVSRKSFHGTSILDATTKAINWWINKNLPNTIK